MSKIKTICFAATVAVALLAIDISSSQAQSGARSFPAFSGARGIAPVQSFATPVRTFRVPTTTFRSSVSSPTFSSAPVTTFSSPARSSCPNCANSVQPVFRQSGVVTSGFRSGGIIGY